MDRAMRAIPLCYAGDHSQCYEHSLVCRHPSPWAFDMIPRHARGQICANSSDCKQLRDIMEIRLGKAALEKTRHGADTNKAESVNRQISKSQPKNITRFRTLAGRIASALHSSNNGTGHSVAMKRLAAGIPLSRNSEAVRVLEDMMERQDFKRSYKMEAENKKQAKANKMKKFQEYDECREAGTYKSENAISKGTRQSPRKRARPDYSTDHVYSQPGNQAPVNDYTDSDEDSEEDIFVHYSSIDMHGYRTLKTGQQVLFDSITGPNGMHATAIKPLDAEGSEAPAENSPVEAQEQTSDSTGNTSNIH